MAIIKCPECGRQISDKAPVCPNCGVEIAGKIIKCSQCGEVYFRDQEVCPNCHHLTRVNTQTSPASGTSAVAQATNNTVTQEQQHQAPVQPVSPKATIPVPPPIPPVIPQQGKASADGAAPPEKPSKKGHGALIIAFVFALIVCALCFYFYSNAKTSKEQEAYEFAMKSNDPLVLQTYLDNNLDAPTAHRDSIMAHLDMLKRLDNDWTNAMVSGSKAALQEYLAKHPDSEHKAEAQHKIDSIDWSDAINENTMESLQAYLNEHANGEHVDEANDALKKLKAKTVQAEDKALVSTVLRRFFQSINARDEAGLEATVAPLLTSFLGKADATKADVVTFMNKIYKEDITNMNWRLGSDYKIDKKEIGDEEYEYTVNLSANQDIERTDETKETHAQYRITAKINPDGLITSMTMTKILE